MYEALNIFFLIFHSSLILFNLFGWIWKPLRKINLASLLLTGLSWFFLGIFYGVGYCPLTDWHYEVLNELGKTNLPSSYIQYLLDFFFNITVSQKTTDLCTMILFFLALICSLYFNYFNEIIKKIK
ncbi:MAG: DUF2784 domain-containing protein [Bacteroidales bacterium]|nr:DUF2784 domain-containing protein [Bacteroidales bacterium]